MPMPYVGANGRASCAKKCRMTAALLPEFSLDALIAAILALLPPEAFTARFIIYDARWAKSVVDEHGVA